MEEKRAAFIAHLKAKPPKSFFDMAGLERDADEESIKKSYRKLVLLLHPDKGGDTELFKVLVNFYETALKAPRPTKKEAPPPKKEAPPPKKEAPPPKKEAPPPKKEAPPPKKEAPPPSSTKEGAPPYEGYNTHHRFPKYTWDDLKTFKRYTVQGKVIEMNEKGNVRDLQGNYLGNLAYDPRTKETSIFPASEPPYFRYIKTGELPPRKFFTFKKA